MELVILVYFENFCQSLIKIDQIYQYVDESAQKLMLMSCIEIRVSRFSNDTIIKTVTLYENQF